MQHRFPFLSLNTAELIPTSANGSRLGTSDYAKIYKE